jgi:site-specific recombinase XerD
MADSLHTPSVVPFPEGSRLKLLDQVRHTIRMRHYSRRTETSAVDWIRRFVVFHRKKHSSTMGVPEITAFLSWLATGLRVSSSTQNQALSALLFLHGHVLRIGLAQSNSATGPHLPRPDKLGGIRLGEGESLLGVLGWTDPAALAT